MTRRRPAVLLAALLLAAVLFPLAAHGLGLGAFGGSEDDLPMCESCCRICPQYPSAEMEDAFGAVPDPVNAPPDVTKPASSATKTLAPRSSAEGASCCNVCPGFGVGHPHPLYSSFLESGEEPVVQYKPFGFQMPPCCNQCQRRTSQPAYDTLMDRAAAKSKMRPSPFDVSAGAGAGAGAPAAAAFIETAVVAAADEALEGEDADYAEAEYSHETQQHSSFLEVRTHTGALAKFGLFLGRAALTASNPAGLCKTPLTESNTGLCCNHCGASSNPFFPPSLEKGVIKAAEGAVSDSELQDKAAAVVDDLLELNGGNATAAKIDAKRTLRHLRAAATRTHREAAMRTKITELRQQELARVRAAMTQLEAAAVVPLSTLGLKILASVEVKLVRMLTPDAPPLLHTGRRDYTQITSEEQAVLGQLPAALRRAVDALRSEGVMQQAKALSLATTSGGKTFPNGTAMPEEGCDDPTPTPDPGQQQQQQQVQAPIVDPAMPVPVPNITEQALTGKQSSMDIMVNISPEIHQALQATQDIIDRLPRSNATTGALASLDKAVSADPANSTQQASFAPVLNKDHPAAKAVENGLAQLPASEGVPKTAVGADGDVMKTGATSSSVPLSGDIAGVLDTVAATTQTPAGSTLNRDESRAGNNGAANTSNTTSTAPPTLEFCATVVDAKQRSDCEAKAKLHAQKEADAAQAAANLNAAVSASATPVNTTQQANPAPYVPGSAAPNGTYIPISIFGPVEKMPVNFTGINTFADPNAKPPAPPLNATAAAALNKTVPVVVPIGPNFPGLQLPHIPAAGNLASLQVGPPAGITAVNPHAPPARRRGGGARRGGLFGRRRAAGAGAGGRRRRF